MKTTSNMKTNSNRKNQTKSKDPKIPNKNYQTKPTKPDLPNQIYQTKPNLPNLTYYTKHTKWSNIYQIKQQSKRTKIQFITILACQSIKLNKDILKTRQVGACPELGTALPQLVFTYMIVLLEWQMLYKFSIDKS